MKTRMRLLNILRLNVEKNNKKYGSNGDKSN